jgi:hypothetical protein
MKNSILISCLATAAMLTQSSWAQEHANPGYVTPKTPPQYEAIPPQNVVTPGDQAVARARAQAHAEAQAQSQAQAQARANAEADAIRERTNSAAALPDLVSPPPAPGSRARSLREWEAGTPDESTAKTPKKYATEAERKADLLKIYQAYKQNLITTHEFQLLKSSIMDAP